MPNADEPSPLAPGTVVGERFVVRERIAGGAQGEVYRAEDREIRGHVVALKLMRRPSRSEVEREVALRELELLAAVRHPSVLQFLDYGWLEGRLWYAMPWLVGETLENKRLGRAEAQPIFEKLAAGLHALHSAGIRHQDIKPANVILARVDGYDEPMPVLLDLGVAVRAGETLAAGSLGYLAPEVAASWPRPNPKLDGKADVFALALTLREVLDPDSLPALPEDESGVAPYLARRAAEPLPPPKRGGLRYLRKPFSEWLHLDPSRRPDAEAFRRQLSVLTAPERARKRIFRAGVVAAALATLVAFGARQTLRAQQLRVESETHARAAESRTREAERAKVRARVALEEAERAALVAAEAREHADDSVEEAERAEELRREAERAALRARQAERQSLVKARAAREARSAAELARKAAEQEVEVSDVERARLSAELSRAREEQARLTAELREARAALSDARASLVTSRASLEDARGAAARSESARAALAAELEALQAKVRDLEAGQDPGGGAPSETSEPAPQADEQASSGAT